MEADPLRAGLGPRCGPVGRLATADHAGDPDDRHETDPHPAADGFDRIDAAGDQTGLIDEDDFLDGRLAGYAQLHLELDFGFHNQLIEFAPASFLASPRGVKYHCLHLRDATVVIPYGTYFSAHAEQAARFSPEKAGPLAQVFLHETEVSAHERLARAGRLDGLNRAIRDLWLQNFDNEILPAPFEIGPLERSHLG